MCKILYGDKLKSLPIFFVIRFFYICTLKEPQVALIKSISGIRGTIGGMPGQNLSPLDLVKFSAAFGSYLMQKSDNKKIVIGRDGRISGELVSNIVVNTLVALGFDVVDLGISTTPTVEIAVTM